MMQLHHSPLKIFPGHHFHSFLFFFILSKELKDTHRLILSFYAHFPQKSIRIFRWIRNMKQSVLANNHRNAINSGKPLGAGRQVDCIRDHRTIHSPGFAHCSKHQISRMDPYADPNRIFAALLQIRIEFAHSSKNCQAGIYCILGLTWK